MRLWLALPALFAVLLVRGHSAGADDATAVVVSVGSQTATVGEIEQRLARLPPHQLRALGATPEAIRKAFVEQVIVPELLHAEESASRQLARTDPRTMDLLRETLRRALQSDLEQQLAQSPPSDTEVRAYYEANRSRYATPQRIQIWRILLGSEADARAVLGEVKAQSGTTRWTQLARERSLDEATKLRDGNLGFVRPDGQTNVPSLRVDTALFRAAESVKDGAIVPDPVREGERWAVVWRRGSVAPVERSLTQEQDGIRKTLARNRLSEELSSLLARLEKSHVSQKNAHLVKYVAISADGDIGARERPGIAPRRAAGSPHPRATDRGLR